MGTVSRDNHLLVESFELTEFLDASSGIYFDGGNFTGGQGIDTVREYARTGDNSLVDEASKYLDKVNASLPDTHKTLWVSSPCGAYPVVSEYLAGSPTSMRMRAKRTQDIAPVNIFVSTTSSGGISASDLVQRGLAITALLLKIQMVRPVELKLLVELGSRGSRHTQLNGRSYIGIITVPSRPLNLGQASFLLTSQGFARGLTYRHASNVGYSQGNWPNEYDAMGGASNNPEYQCWLAKTIGANPNDLIIPTCHIQNIINDPTEWITAQLEKIASARLR